MDIRLALMCGTDIPVPECQTVIHQPTIKEIALIGEQEFFAGAQTLCVTKNLLHVQDKSILEGTNNFQIFMMIMGDKEHVEKKQAVKSVLMLLFPKHRSMITPRSLVLQSEGESITIDENNFEVLQEYIIQICCLYSGGQGEQSFNPADAKAAEIAQKLMRGRQRVAEQKTNGANNVSVFSQYLSALTIGIQSMSLNDLMNLTMYQLFDLMERFQLYMAWDLDVRTRLAGGKPDTQAENWMKNIH